MVDFLADFLFLNIAAAPALAFVLLIVRRAYSDLSGRALFLPTTLVSSIVTVGVYTYLSHGQWPDGSALLLIVGICAFWTRVIFVLTNRLKNLLDTRSERSVGTASSYPPSIEIETNGEQKK